MKSGAIGLGAGFLWTPTFAEGRNSVLGEFMRDVHAENRFDCDYLTLIGSWKF